MTEPAIEERMVRAEMRLDRIDAAVAALPKIKTDIAVMHSHQQGVQSRQDAIIVGQGQILERLKVQEDIANVEKGRRMATLTLWSVFSGLLGAALMWAKDHWEALWR